MLHNKLNVYMTDVAHSGSI